MNASHIVTAADVAYVPYLACFLLSVGERATKDQALHITIIHQSIPAFVQRRLRQLVPERHQVCWFEPTAESLRAKNAAADLANLSPHYWRLLTPFVLAEATRGLYIDCDTIVLGDLSPLWTLDLKGNVIAAATDCFPCVGDAVDNHDELGLSPTAAYFNSGVLVIDVARWRAERVTERVLQTCRDNADHLYAHGKWPQYDQYGLNVVLGRQWLALGREWNHWAFLPKADARIVHYVGDSKPHLPACQPAFGRLFSETLARTPFGAGRNVAS